jgi:carbohydrate-selective porin OprB
MFNSLKYVKVLEDIGIPRNQAEAHIQIMTEIIETNLATKQDLADLRLSSGQEFKDLRTEMHQGFTEVRSEFQSLRSDLENKIIQSEYRMTIKLGTIVSIAIGVAVALTKLV